MSVQSRTSFAADPVPVWLTRALLALGVLSVIALPALTGVFAMRLDDAFGMTYAPVAVESRETSQGTFTFFRVNAIKADADQDFWFEEGRAVLRTGNGEVNAAAVTARACREESPGCARELTMLFPVAPQDLAGAWSIHADLTWLSRDLRVTSAHEASLTGEELSFRE